MGEIPSSGYNPLRVSLDPSDPDYLKKMGMIGAMEGQHELNAPQSQATDYSKEGLTAPAGGEAPKMKGASAPAQPEAPTMSATNTQMMDPNAVLGVPSLPSGSTEPNVAKPQRSVLGKIEHGLEVAGNIAGNVLAPGIMADIPGTEMHKSIQAQREFQQNIQKGAQDIEKQKVEATEQEKETEIASREEMSKNTLAMRDEIAHLSDATKSGDTAAMIASREKINQLSNQLKTVHDAQQFSEFKTGDQYKRWKSQLDNDTKLKVADMTQNKAPAQITQNAVMAQGALRGTSDIRSDMKKLEASGAMGSLPANWVETYLFAHGAVDPNLPPEVRQIIGHMQTASDLVASATTRAHTARGSKEVYDDLKSKLGPGQDWNAFRGALDEVDGMLNPYVDAASTDAMKKLREGTTGASGAPPKGAKVIKLEDFLKGKQ
jgi:hypothetical protein